MDDRMLDGNGAARQLQELSELKSAFLKLTIHELRRPLLLSHGYLSMILDGSLGELPQGMDQTVRQIGAGHEEMANLIDGLAAAACLEDRADALKLAPYGLCRLAREAATAVSAEAAAKHIRIELCLPRGEVEARIDAQQMRIALVNLVGNAIKFAPNRTRVTVSVHRGRAGDLVLVVKDQGPGMDQADVGRVFQKWSRGRWSHTPGLGLGLYIVRMIVDLHGGYVTVHSTPGEGASFDIVLPAGD
jgi:signal transduction histidine kinase